MLDRATISVNELAKILAISKCKAYELVRSTGFPVLRLGRSILIPVCELKKWISENTVR